MFRRSGKSRLIQAVVLLSLVLFLTVWLGFLLPLWGVPFNYARHTRIPLTPAWALECWLWEDDLNTADAVRNLLAGYEQYDIPVRTVLIDSPWSTRYNDFAVDETRYPDPEGFFRELEDRGYRVVLWMTPLVNRENDDTRYTDAADWFEEARSRGYLVRDDHLTGWWKGRGGFIDYTHPGAMAWWRGLQQPLFDWGIDGWKLDGAATLNARLYEVPGIGWRFPFLTSFYMRARGGLMTTRGYMDRYYRDEYRHGLSQNPEFITLARSYDGLAHPEGFAPFDAAPVTWVGDQDHTWSKKDGLEEALEYVLRAARLGYGVVGSDVAGYGGPEIPPKLYIRWAQFSTFCGLFLNGGHGERALWKRSPEELEIVRKYSWLHTELVPYIYSHLVEQRDGGAPLMRPVSGYDYRFGEAFFVAPLSSERDVRRVRLPEGRWRYFFDDREVLDTAAVEWKYGLDQYPVFVRDGAIVPLNVTRPYTGLGDRDSQGFLTLLVYPHGRSEYTVHHPDGSGSTVVRVERGAETVEIVLEGVKKPHILRVLLEDAPGEIVLDGTPLPRYTWRYDPDRTCLWVKTWEYGEGRYSIRLSGAAAPHPAIPAPGSAQIPAE